jgi:FkbM family methyltransferase
LFALQIGAFDGVTDDFLYPLLQATPEMLAWRFEPEPRAFALLSHLHAGDSRVECFPVAVVAQGGPFVRLWRFRGKTNLPWTDQGSSLQPQATEMREYSNLLEPILVRAETLESVCRRCPPIDLLIIDAEGLDHDLLLAFPWRDRRPLLVYFEYKHMREEQYAEVRAKLTGMGYHLMVLEQDVLATLE